MALATASGQIRETGDQIRARFGIDQDSKPSDEQLRYQRAIAAEISTIALIINRDVADGREKSVALTKLEEALMWAGKAIFA